MNIRDYKLKPGLLSVILSFFVALPVMLGVPQGARAIIEIEITKGGANAIPIAIAEFAWVGAGNATEDVAQIIADDLLRSGLFNPMERSELIANPIAGEIPDYASWRLAGADYLVIGSVNADNRGFRVDFQLFDPVIAKNLTALSFSVTNQTLRNAAHRIADEIFQEVTGIRGAFNTDIAYVSVAGTRDNRSYRLQLADADGFNPQDMLNSPRPIMSPSWSPDGKSIAYVSFENREQSAIYVQDRRTGQRKKLISKQGINGAPSWSPDGSKLAVVLSYAGNPDIYIVDVASGRERAVTTSDAIDTEPEWVDNNVLVFTSNRSGGPQLYEIPVGGGRAQRLTFEGSYNSNPSVSPDGSKVAFVHSNNGRSKIAVIDRGSKDFRVLTDGTLDESPSFAPNGQMILFATSEAGLPSLGAVSVDGDFVQRLALDSGGVREPAWSPFSN